MYASGYGHKLLVEFGLSGDVPKRNLSTEAWQSCLEKLNVDVDIVFIGDSITRGGNFHEYFADYSVCNLGLGSDSVVEMKKRVGMISAVNPEKIFLMVGINDILLSKGDLTIIANNYEELLKSISEISDAEIYIQSLIPVNEEIVADGRRNADIIELNKLLQHISDKYEITFIDLFALYEENGQLPKNYTLDGLHLKEEAYIAWYMEVEKYIQ